MVEAATEDADVVIMGVPSHAFRQVLQDAAPYVRPWIPVVSLVKGLEQGTDERMSQIVAEVLPGSPAGILAGPNIAKEVANGYAAAATIAMPDQNSAGQLAALFRTYALPDLLHHRRDRRRDRRGVEEHLRHRRRDVGR